MPDHTTPAITTDACRCQGGQQGLLGGVELMIGGDLLAEFAAIVTNGDENSGSSPENGRVTKTRESRKRK
ncbi:hypothetical protein GGI1_24731, partial [Acidithiobacillus sp. GGI-221]